MTVSTSTTRNTYAGNGVTVTFAFTFAVLQPADLVVSTVDDDTGAETVLVLNTDYTIADGARFPKGLGGSVTLTATPATGRTVLLQRVLSLLQPTDYKNQGRFFAETHETSFDRLTMQVQQVADALDRVAQQPASGRPWYDFQNNRAINVGDAIDAQDAVNLRVMEAAISDAVSGIGGFVVPTVWTFTGDGTTTVFSIPGAPISAASTYEVAIDGILQIPTADYTIQLGAETITFIPAPPNGSSIFVRARGYAAPVGDVEWDAEGERIRNVGAPVLGGDAVNLDFLNAALAGKADVGHVHAGTDITSGFVPPQHLGTGARDGSKFLRDDGQWISVSASLGLPFTDRGDLLVYGGASSGRLAVGTNGQVLIADSNETLGVRWGDNTPAASGVQTIVQAMLVDTATIDLATNGTGFQASVIAGSIGTTQLTDAGVTTAKLADLNVTTGKLADLAVTAAKIANSTITAGKLATTGTADSTSYLRGDMQWISAPFAPTVHTHAPTDVTGLISAGFIDPTILGAGYGGIPSGDRANWVLNAAGSWTTLEALYDGTVVAGGSGSGGGGYNNEAAQDAVGAIFQSTATITATYNDGAPSMTWDVVDGSIGLTKINTASLDTRYALVGGGGGGSLPPGGTGAQFLRGDGVWSSTLTGGLTLGSGISFSQGSVSGTGITRATDGGPIELITTPAASVKYGRVTLDASGGDPFVDVKVRPDGGSGFGRGLRVTHTGGAYQVLIGDLSLPVDTTFRGNVTMLDGSLTASITASSITSGIISTARLGSGTPSSANYLRGDGAWVPVPSGGAITVADTARIDLTLNGSNQLSADLVAASITSTYLGTGAVTTAKIADANITSAKFAAGAVTTAAIADANVTTAKLAVSAVTSSILAASSVGSSKIQTGAVTPEKLYTGSGAATAEHVYWGDGRWAPPTSGLASDNTWTNRNYWTTAAGGNTNEVWFNYAANGTAAVRVERTGAPTPGTTAGTFHVGFIRTGGTTGSANQFYYDDRANVTGSFFDIGMTTITSQRRLNASDGSSMAQWIVSLSPSIEFQSTPDEHGITHSWTNGAVIAAEVNYGNAWADFGLIEDRRVVARWVAGFLMVPDHAGKPYSGNDNRFHASAGIGFAASGTDSYGRSAKHHIGIYFEENSIAPNGYMQKWWGGSSGANAPARAVKGAGQFQEGIDLYNCTFTSANQVAISIGPNHSIVLGSGRIWFDSATNRLKCSDSLGTRDL